MDGNRRAVLASVVGATTLVTGAPAPSAKPRQAPQPAFDGEIRFDEPIRSAAASDFGHLLHEMPEGVLLPGSDSDLLEVVRWARARGVKLAARGQGHSVFGRSMARNGIVVDMTRLRAVRDIRSDQVVVDAGAQWSEVLAATLPRGLTPPVLTDYLGLSVGGTLIVGGVGSRTCRFGVQTDNVISMDVVTGAGERVTCSASSNAALFDAMRAGLGQVGIVARATLKLMPAPQQVRRFLLFYPDLNAMVADGRLLAKDDRFDSVQGAILAAPTGGWMFRLEAVKEFTGTPPDDDALLGGLSDDPAGRQSSTLTFFDYLNRLAALEAALRANGQWMFPHPWLTTFLGDSEVESVVAGELTRLTPPDLGPFGQVTLSAFHRHLVTSPMLRLPSGELCFVFNLIRIPATNSVTEAARLVEANRVAYDRIRAKGGMLYPVSALPMSRDDWRRHFGSAFARLNDAKRGFDPDGILTPGYGIF